MSSQPHSLSSNQPNPTNPSNNKIRLNKFLAERLGISRREADELIDGGKVFVDDEPAIIGAKIDKSNKVCYNDKVIPFEEKFLYLEMNKPVGYVCSKGQQGENPTIYELLPEKYKTLKTVGRLDKDSSGLILLTNDGDFAFRMTHPKFKKTKIYIVELDKNLEPLHQQMISDFGVELSDGKSRFMLMRLDPPESETRKKFEVTMSEGRNRQIRRTFGALGYTVRKLHRTNFGDYSLKGLKTGEVREISA